MAGAAGLSDDALELVDLLLGTAEGSELDIMLVPEVVGGEEGRRESRRTLFFASFLARLSRLLRRSSITRRS